MLWLYTSQLCWSLANEVSDGECCGSTIASCAGPWLMEVSDGECCGCTLASCAGPWLMKLVTVNVVVVQ